MAKFCANCGNPMAEGARFCDACGAAVPGQPAASQPVGTPSVPPAAMPPAASPAAYPPSTAPAPSSSGMKILFLVLAIFAFLGLLAAGSCFYVAYRVKKKASEFRAEMGTNAPYTGRRDACSKLSKSEVGDAIGQPVTSVESHGESSCVYILGPDKRVAVEYTWEGGAMVMRMSRGAMKSISGMETFQAVHGVGDEAYLEPMGSGLMMRKGDVLVHIDMRTAGLNADAAKAMATEIADRL